MHSTLPAFVSWRIWKARSHFIFEEKPLNPFACSLQIVGLYKDYYGVKFRINRSNNIEDLHEAKGFFEGVSQGGLYAAGVILRLNGDHYFTFKLNCGYGTNIKVELISFWCLTKISSSFGIDSLKIFGGSLVVINWSKGIQNSQVIDL